MRHAIVPLLLALAATTASAQSKPPRAAPPDAGAGRIAWFDISTSNLAKSKEFYGKLFEWTFDSVTGTDQAVEILSRGTPIGTLRTAEGPLSPFNGVVYVQVADVKASCSKAAELGGTVVPGFPFNLTDRPGAICLVADPAGHPIGMYSRTPLAK